MITGCPPDIHFILSISLLSVVSLKCRDLVVRYRFACSPFRIALHMLDMLRKARIALSQESLAVFL